MREIRTDDVCRKCNKRSLSVVNYTTSGSLILLLTECFECGWSITITRKMREKNGNGNVKGMDALSTVSARPSRG